MHANPALRATPINSRQGIATPRGRSRLSDGADTKAKQVCKTVLTQLASRLFGVRRLVAALGRPESGDKSPHSKEYVKRFLRTCLVARPARVERVTPVSALS